jgi:hypothetical protein
MLISPSWRHAPRPLLRMIERLEIEHLRHGGFENGNLYVSYKQFVMAGISKRSIKPTMELGKALGLMDYRQDEEPSGDIRPPNAYRLTYVLEKGKKVPSDEWKAVTDERAKQLVEQYKQAEKTSAKAKGREAA